ncbi:hypothetical protein SAMN05519103_09557 [Rhizobiales bacterium GAS113]|nr:hypothetical protein SAMN05519103_09557 [Rhizobiales bacterium GAS113]
MRTGTRGDEGVATKGFDMLMRTAGKAAARLAKDHAPDIATKTPVVTMLDPIELGALNVWIADQPDPKPSRPKAMRRPLAEALIR